MGRHNTSRADGIEQNRDATSEECVSPLRHRIQACDIMKSSSKKHVRAEACAYGNTNIRQQRGPCGLVQYVIAYNWHGSARLLYVVRLGQYPQPTVAYETPEISKCEEHLVLLVISQQDNSQSRQSTTSRRIQENSCVASQHTQLACHLRQCEADKP
jgi:hypothetical protein